MVPEPKKILFLTASLGDGGAQRVFSLLLQYLDRQRFEPHLAVMQDGGSYIQDLPEDVVVHRLHASRARYALPAVVRLVWRLKPGTIISTLRHMNALLMLCAPFLPPHTKLLLRETSIPTQALAGRSIHARVWRLLLRRLYKRADGVVSLSDAMARDLVENLRVPAAKVTRIYNPVDRQRICVLAGAGSSPYSGPGPRLVSAARFCRAKGLDLLLDAMPAVVQRFPTAELIILGDGPLREELKSRAQQYGLVNVRFPGFDPNPWRYFRHADLFVLPSRSEGMPNALLEALALGVSVVATDCSGGVREIQSCDPEMVLVAPESAPALAEGILLACGKQLNGRPPKQMPGLAKFDLQRAVNEYSELF